VYKNAWLRLREDNVIRPDGKQGIYSVVELPHSAGIVAIDDDDEVMLVGQWRYPNNLYSWEIPTGSMDANETPLQAAKRELREECGCTASRWTSLGTIQNSNGATTDIAHLFLARELKAVGRADHGEGIQMKRVPLHRAIRMAATGQITESSSVAALLKADRLRRR
jgi:8-oxo-dGTP pyrophosphatase MutT (NUDIX family)